MAYEFGLDAVFAIEGLLEGEDDEHAVDVFLDKLDAVFLPGPKLRAHEEDYRNAELVEFFGEFEVDVGEVDEDGGAGAAGADGLLELAEFSVDAGQVADDFGDSHDGYVFRADDAFETGGGHALAAHAEICGGLAGFGELAFEGLDQKGAVVLAAGFACRDEEVGRHECAGLHHSGLAGGRVRGWRDLHSTFPRFC